MSMAISWPHYDADRVCFATRRLLLSSAGAEQAQPLISWETVSVSHCAALAVHAESRRCAVPIILWAGYFEQILMSIAISPLRTV